MTIAPIAAEDVFAVAQGLTSTTVSGNLGADNGAGLDYDPDGTVLGWVAGSGFSPIGDGDRYLGAFFSEGVLAFLSITGTVSYPFPIITTSTAIATAAGGQVWLDTSGNFSYQSALGFSGVDSFTYTLVDGAFNLTTTTVTINVAATEGANDRPIAAADVFQLNEDTVLSGNLLADNGLGPDSDADGDAISVAAGRYVTDKGSVLTVAANGAFTFRAGDLSYGLEVLSYTLVDALGATTTGSVQFRVGGHGGHQGSYLGENWTGSAGADVAMMAGGDDSVDGLGGHDLIGGGADDDTLLGGLGNDRLYGEGDKDDLFGGSGADRLDGGAGHDRLRGGAGADRFVLSARAEDSDRIADFASVDRLVFTAAELGLSSGPLADASWLVAKGAADGDHGRFVYDARTRGLSWDDDGLAATAAQLVVTFDTKVALTLDNFLLV